MLELEIQKLTAAIQELTVELKSAKVGNQLATEAPANSDKPRQKKAKVTTEEAEALVEAAKPVSDQGPAQGPQPVEPEAPSEITEESLKTVAMELVRADSSAKPAILNILSDKGVKTFTHLDPKHYNFVHGELLKLAKTIYDESEAV
jgi:hypothetical protein